MESSGSGQLELNNGSNTATISTAVNSQTISAPLELLSNTLLDPSTLLTLAISGNITGTGKSLTVGDSTHDGTVILGGADSYGGGTTVANGTLIVNISGALPARKTLTIDAGGRFIFDPTVSAAPVSLQVAAASVAQAAAAVPAAASTAATVAVAAPQPTRAVPLAHDTVLQTLGRDFAWAALADQWNDQGPTKKQASTAAAVDAALMYWR